jgi:hypothetical protein
VALRKVVWPAGERGKPSSCSGTEITQMQSKVPETDLRIQITPILKTAIEATAAADGQSVNAWVSDLLERAVTRAQEIADANGSAEEEQRKQVEAKKEAVSDMLKRMMGH